MLLTAAVLSFSMTACSDDDGPNLAPAAALSGVSVQVGISVAGSPFPPQSAELAIVPTGHNRVQLAITELDLGITPTPLEITVSGVTTSGSETLVNLNYTGAVSSPALETMLNGTVSGTLTGTTSTGDSRTVNINLNAVVNPTPSVENPDPDPIPVVVTITYPAPIT